MNQRNYVVDHLWNLDEINIQVGKQIRGWVLARRESNVINSTIPKSWEWLTLNYVVYML
jgi:hypothetical protein